MPAIACRSLSAFRRPRPATTTTSHGTGQHALPAISPCCHVCHRQIADDQKCRNCLQSPGQFSQIALLADFQQVYEKELAHLRAERAAKGPIKIIWTGAEYEALSNLTPSAK
jgi:hypothetical protein